MSFAIAWHAPALVTLYRLPMHSAMVVDKSGAPDDSRTPPLTW